MRSRISALMDGELMDFEIEETVRALFAEYNDSHAWNTFHLIGDVLRGMPTLSAEFLARFSVRLAKESKKHPCEQPQMDGAGV